MNEGAQYAVAVLRQTSYNTNNNESDWSGLQDFYSSIGSSLKYLLVSSIHWLILQNQLGTVKHLLYLYFEYWL